MNWEVVFTLGYSHLRDAIPSGSPVLAVVLWGITAIGIIGMIVH